MSAGWSGSNRKRRLPRGWATIRLRILDRDGQRCTWHDNGARCTSQATDVDHIIRGDNHDDANLTSLCHYHHGAKSGKEGAAARRAQPTNQRPPERHPGLLP